MVSRVTADVLILRLLLSAGGIYVTANIIDGYGEPNHGSVANTSIAFVSMVVVSQVTANFIDGYGEPGYCRGANTAVAVVSMVVVSQVTANCIDGYGEPGYC
jgi:hypothetical protein